MNTLNRLIAVCVMLLLVLPAAALGLAGQLTGDKVQMEEELQSAIRTAAVGYRQRGGLQAARGKAEEVMIQRKAELARIQREKRVVRLKLGGVLKKIKTIEAQIAIPLSNTGAIAAMIEDEMDEFSALVVAAYRWKKQIDGSVSTILLHSAADRSIGARELSRQRDETMLSIRALSDALTLRSAFDAGYADLEALRAQYATAEAAYDDAAAARAEADAEIEQIKRITAEVHADVLRLQALLARIDARLKSKVERALVEKGLMDPETAKKKAATAAVRFLWPVYGPISAGFRDADYADYFNVEHQAIDIVVPQSTPVGAATDGVVFLVRDGGQYGYTYILIGHRDGYATLYGHLSATSVRAGEEVVAGQTIGLSGGRPGTRGAGPMTTGAHLHFEVIKDGQNINPKTMLP